MGYIMSLHRKLHKKLIKFRQAKAIPLASPFHHRENLLNLLIFADLLTFLGTIVWMEFSQAVVEDNEVATTYQIAPLSLFTHHCDSYFTYVWILLFNISTFIALIVVTLCIYAIHQTSFEPACIIFFLLTLVSFITVGIFPIIAFISFFKISVFVLSSLSQSNINIVPAIYSKYVCFPVHDNLNHPNSDLFYQKLYRFLYQDSKTHHQNYMNWDIILTLFTSLLIPIFAFFHIDDTLKNSAEKNHSIESRIQKKSKIKQHDEEYQLRIGIANKVLAEYYTKSFFVSYDSKSIAERLMNRSYTECTAEFVRKIRGYKLSNIIQSIKHSFTSEFRAWNDNQDSVYPLSIYDKLLELQYRIIVFVFVPLQITFAIYGIMYPYFIAYQVVNDLYAHGSMSHQAVIQNEAIKMFTKSILSTSDSMWLSLYILKSHSWYFCVFAVCLIGQLLAMCCIIYKVWKLRHVLEMCLNVFIIQDNAILNDALVQKMEQLRINIEATRVRDRQLAVRFGRYHLDKLIVEFAGGMHECECF